MQHIPVRCQNCTNPFCMSLPRDALTKICESSQTISFRPKKEQYVCFDRGHIMIVEDGQLMTIKTNADGKQQGIDILRSGDLLGIVQLFSSENQNIISLLPLSPVKGCIISVNLSENIIRSDNNVAILTISHMASRFYRAVDHLYEGSISESMKKLDNAISITRSSGNSTITHEELSILSGLNRVTVTKSLKNSKDYSEK